MQRSPFSLITSAVIAFVAIAAVVVWPRYLDQSGNVARASALPTMAPVVADYRQRDRLVAFWERATDENKHGDMLSPRMLAEQYLQRYRERNDIDDVLRADRAVRRSLAVQPVGNLGGELELASIFLTVHRFHDALDVTHDIERWDAGDQSMYAREASLDMEVGDYAQARRRLDAVRAKNRDDAWSVVESRYLELTGNLAAARSLLDTASAYQNGNFDAPAQSRAWYFFRAGEMAFEAGDNDAALQNERTALSIFPGYADASRALARFECSLHQWQACLGDATISANEVPYPESLGYKADAQRALGDAAGAAQTEDLIQTIGRLGDSRHITDRLLAVYDSDHRAHTADAYAIAKGELTARDDIFTEDTLAWAAAMDGRWGEARAASAKAVRYHTENALLEYHAGMIALHFGDRAGAKAHLARAVALNAHFHPTFADDARAQIAAL